MSLAVDRIRSEALAKIQDVLISMDIKMANVSHCDSVPEGLPSPETRARLERTAIALDEIRGHVQQAYGEEAKVSGRLVHLWLDIRAKAIESNKAGM